MVFRGLFVALTLAWSSATCASDFMERVQERMGLYAMIEEQGKSDHLPSEGRLAELTRRQLAAVPDGEKDAVDYFFLGNMTFAIDDELSYELMMRAEAMEPKNHYIAYERALHEHRRGDCGLAVPYYEKFHASERGRSREVSYALLSDCQLRTGRHDSAGTIAWRSATPTAERPLSSTTPATG